MYFFKDNLVALVLKEKFFYEELFIIFLCKIIIIPKFTITIKELSFMQRPVHSSFG